LPQKEEQLDILLKKTQHAEFWSDAAKARVVQKEIKSLQEQLKRWESLNKQVADALELQELSSEDPSMAQEVFEWSQKLQDELESMELQKMLSGPDDGRSALLAIHPGAGGTESQDWAQMLMRMYTRFFERRGFQYDLLDDEPGDEAGIKSATFEINGDFVYGTLKSEIGVHRLVRISPFDSNARRHTSFAAVSVYPIVEDVEIVIDEKDIKVDTYRASGAGGQHINKTDSAVRMTHLPTGIVVTCQSERSQHKNRANALKLLRARVYQKHKDEEEAKQKEKEGSKLKIEWGSQIRSYTLHPYNLVKDVRTDWETSNARAVLDGDLDPFIKAFLLSGQK